MLPEANTLHGGLSLSLSLSLSSRAHIAESEKANFSYRKMLIADLVSRLELFEGDIKQKLLVRLN